MKAIVGTCLAFLLVFGGMGIFGAKHAPSATGVVVWAFPVAVPILLYAVFLYWAITSLLEGELLQALGGLFGGALTTVIITFILFIPYWFVQDAYQYHMIKQEACPAILKELPKGERLCTNAPLGPPFFHFNPPGWENW